MRCRATLAMTLLRVSPQSPKRWKMRKNYYILKLYGRIPYYYRMAPKFYDVKLGIDALHMSSRPESKAKDDQPDEL